MLLLFLLASQIDLNRAPLEEIYKLPVDSTVARRIYDYRAIYGYFNSVFELRNVEGIDGILFEKIKPLVKIVVPAVERTEWGSILYEQKKLASEEPPSKAAVDVWEDLIRSPMNVNEATFDELLNIDRMTPTDAAAILRHRQLRPITSARDLRRVRDLSYYAYSSLRKYVQYEAEPLLEGPYGSVRLRLDNTNRLDIGEDENLATRISYLETAVNQLDTIGGKLDSIYGWEASHIAGLRTNLVEELYTLQQRSPHPTYDVRARINYQQKFRVGISYDEYYDFAKGYVGIAHIKPIQRFYLGNYRIVLGEGLMIDNSDEYRARIYERSSGIYGDLTENYGYRMFGAAGTFLFDLRSAAIMPSFFYSSTMRDAIMNPDGSVWQIFNNPYRFSIYKNKVNEQAYGASFAFAPLEKTLPGTQVSLEGMRLGYDKTVNPDPRWIDIPLDSYEPDFYPEISALSFDSTRTFLGAAFVLPVRNTFISGEIVRQHDAENPAYAYLVKGRIQYDYFYLNILFRHFDVGYDNPFNRGFSEYRRFEDTPFERPYALVDPEYASMYDDPVPKAEQGIYLETRYQLTRNFLISRAYLDIFENLGHNLLNQRGYFEFEYQPIWPIRLRFSQKIIRKHLPRNVQPTLSTTHETALRSFFYLPNFDALRVEARFGMVDLTARDADDLILEGGFLSFSFTHNFSEAFSFEGGFAIWKTDGMSQWIFEDVGIDFLYADGVKFYLVSSQKIGNMLLKAKFSQKFTQIPHNGLVNNDRIYYPDLPGLRVTDYTDNENRTIMNLQIDYLF
jgi:DNA uptake protein ComE-like DNA-binding protein